MQHTRNSSVLKIICAATMGIVAAVTTYLAERGCHICHSSIDCACGRRPLLGPRMNEPGFSSNDALV